jgi:hypothetical protein
MGGTLYSKLIYYWIFIFGGLTVSYLLKLLDDGIDFIILMVALTLVYWGMEFVKARNQKRRGIQPANGPARPGKKK